ncbi:MAG: hypothetical protein IKH24_08210 [Bacteroidales bacterium]|nr:hypothetical protein [Bacteroidales bacterium]
MNTNCFLYLPQKIQSDINEIEVIMGDFGHQLYITLKDESFLYHKLLPDHSNTFLDYETIDPDNLVAVIVSWNGDNHLRFTTKDLIARERRIIERRKVVEKTESTRFPMRNKCDYSICVYPPTTAQSALIEKLFYGVRRHNTKWTVIAETPMPKDIADSIKEIRVVKGDNGLQLCFFLKRGGQIYKKIAEDASFTEGQIIDPYDITVVELAKPGEDNIVRFK